MNPLLRIKDVVLAYDENIVVDRVSLEVQRGSFIGLVGPNGAGKTTFLLAISGQFYPQSGRILFQGQDIYEHNYDYKHNIGFVHETPFFYPNLSVEEFLWFIARVKRMDKQMIAFKIKAILRAVRLLDEKSKMTSQLSQGMRKKLAIAAAMIDSPRIVFLDEALNGVDVESAFHIKKMLTDYAAGGGTVILSTHVVEVIEKMCDRYVVLKNGKIIADFNASDEPRSMGLEARIMGLLKASTEGNNIK